MPSLATAALVLPLGTLALVLPPLLQLEASELHYAHGPVWPPFRWLSELFLFLSTVKADHSIGPGSIAQAKANDTLLRRCISWSVRSDRSLFDRVLGRQCGHRKDKGLCFSLAGLAGETSSRTSRKRYPRVLVYRQQPCTWLCSSFSFPSAISRPICKGWSRRATTGKAVWMGEEDFLITSWRVSSRRCCLSYLQSC